MGRCLGSPFYSGASRQNIGPAKIEFLTAGCPWFPVDWIFYLGQWLKIKNKNLIALDFLWNHLS